MNRPVIIVGATAGIGRAIARALAEQGRALLLAGRDRDELEVNATDLRIASDAEVEVVGFDATQFDRHGAFFEACLERAEQRELGGIIVCHGFMADQREAMADFDKARQMIDVNHTASVSLLNRVAEHLRQQGNGFICGVSSVAGDRGRQSNFLYGSTKAAFSAYLQGLRNAVDRDGVHVLTVKPGIVVTSMTWGQLKPASPLPAEPERVAEDVVGAIRRQRNVIYTPWFWRWIMLVIRLIPEPVFKRMRL